MALHGHLETEFYDALNLRTGIDIGIVGLVVVLIPLAKVHTTSQFSQYHEVSTTNQFVFQRRLMQQTVEGSHRTDIGKESEFLTHGQQSYLRTNLSRGIVVVLQVAYGSKEYGIGPHTHLVGGIGIRIAHLVDGVSTTDGLFVLKLMSTLLGYRVEHSHTLFHDLGSDTIARQNCNLQIHSSLF